MMMGIEELKGSLLEAIRGSDDEDLLQDLKFRVDIDYYLKDKGIASILGGVDTIVEFVGEYRENSGF